MSGGKSGRPRRVGRLGGRQAGALRRVPLAMWNDDATDRAAALTYYAVLAIFPALLVTVCCIGLAGPGASGKLADQVTSLVPEQSRILVHGVLVEMSEQRQAAWLLASFGPSPPCGRPPAISGCSGGPCTRCTERWTAARRGVPHRGS